jgi:hypothetical protein
MTPFCSRIVALVALALMGCEQPRAPKEAAQTTVATTSLDSETAATSTVVKPVVPVLPEPSLTCTPTTFGPNDTLTLAMKVPHGDYLIATQPGDSLFYVIYPERSGSTRNYSLIAPESFKQTAMLRLPGDVKAVPWYAGRDTTVAPLFPRPGKYVLTMGENLAGDNARAASCRVTFTD